MPSQKTEFLLLQSKTQYLQRVALPSLPTQPQEEKHLMSGIEAASLAGQLALLRAATHRLSATPTAHLPRCAAQIAATIWNCRDVLSLNLENTKSSSEITSVVHRFRTTITNLLQDRSIQGRWAAVNFVKATIEAGGVVTLSKSNGWIRSLISILKKGDPPSTRRLTIITLTRIFTLSGKHPNLVRELTTPNLPTFVTSCLSNLHKESLSSGAITAILESFAILLPKHSTIFRTFESQLRSVLLQIAASTNTEAKGNLQYNTRHRSISNRLLVLLHYCAPKQSHSEKWHETLKSAVTAAHRTSDVIFRSIIESREHLLASELLARPTTTELQTKRDDHGQLVLPTVGDLHACVDRLAALLQLISSYLQTDTVDAVNIELGQIMGLLARLTAITQVAGNGQAIKANPGIPKDERETMFQLLPIIHTSAIELARIIILRFGTAAIGLISQLLDNVLHVFVCEGFETTLRTAIFEFIKAVLDLVGPILTKQTVSELSTIIQACYTELLSTDSENSHTNTVAVNVSNVSQIVGASSSKLDSSSHRTSRVPEVERAANNLLTTVITKLDTTTMKPKLRTQLERTAILTRNLEALLACTLNPATVRRGKPRASLLPILARQDANSPAVEALLRPRMPTIGYGASETLEGVSTPISHDEYESPHVDVPITGNIQFDANGEQDNPVDPSHAPSFNRETNNGLSVVAEGASGSVSQPESKLSNKRSASQDVEPLHLQKRWRESSDSSKPQDDLINTDVAIPTTVVSLQETSHASADCPVVQSVMVPDTISTATTGPINTYDSDSDFELPPLTMEPDTDPEDEEND